MYKFKLKKQIKSNKKEFYMYDNDSKTNTDYEYNHALDELMQMRAKVNMNLDQFKGKHIEWSEGEFSTITEAFYEDTGIKVLIENLGLIEFEIEDFFKCIR